MFTLRVIDAGCAIKLVPCAEELYYEFTDLHDELEEECYGFMDLPEKLILYRKINSTFPIDLSEDLVQYCKDLID